MVYSFDYDSDYYPSAPVVEIGISKAEEQEKKRSLITLIDSGADATIIPIHILNEIGVRAVEGRKVFTAFGGSHQVKLFRVAIYVGAFRIPAIRVIAATQGNEAMLGRDVLNQLILTLNGPALTTEIQE